MVISPKSRMQVMWSWLHERHHEYAAVAASALPINLQRLQWLASVVLSLNLVHLAHSEPGAPAVLWALSLLVLAALLLTRWAGRALPQRTGAGRCALAMILLNGAFSTIVLPASAGAPSAESVPLMVAFTNAMVFLLSPAWSVPLYAGSALLGLGMLGSMETWHWPDVVVPNLLGWVIAQLRWQHYTRRELLQRELLAQKEYLEQLVVRDPLTGLYNRAEFERRAGIELARMRRYGGCTSLIVVDLDHFKRINDQHGHPAGDAVLQCVARLLQQTARVTDVVARLGGEEFIVLLPGTDPQAARTAAERLRARLDMRIDPMARGEVVVVSASLGVACVPAESEPMDFGGLYSAADQALYRAKASGRNRVECA